MWTILPLLHNRPLLGGVVALIGKALPILRAYVSSKGMITSDPKEQFYSPTKDVLDLWLRLHPKYSGKLSKHAKDLGAAQRPLGVASKLRGNRLVQAKSKVSRVRNLRIGRHPKVLMTRASVQAGAMYACEAAL